MATEGQHDRHCSPHVGAHLQHVVRQVYLGHGNELRVSVYGKNDSAEWQRTRSGDAQLVLRAAYETSIVIVFLRLGSMDEMLDKTERMQELIDVKIR